MSSPISNAKLLVASGLFLTLFLLSAVLGLEVRSRLNDLSTASTDNMQWNLAQLEVELLRLERAVDVAGDGSPEALADLRVRFDIFYSRVQTYAAGALYQPLWQQPENRAVLDDLQSYLQGAIGWIDGDDAVLSENLAPLQQATQAQIAPVRQVLLNGVSQFAAQSDTARRDLSRTMLRLALSLCVLILALASLSLLLLLLLRRGWQITEQGDVLRARLEAMVGSSLDAILVIDTQGKVLEFNGAAANVFGYTEDEAVGQKMCDLIIPENMRQAHRDGMKRFRETGEKRVTDAGRLQLEAQRKSGEIFPVEVSIAAAQAGESPVFVAFLRDITQQLQSEADLKQARDEAQASERAKSDLLTVMSHEMRTPLNGILGSLELIQRDPLSQRQARHLEAARVSGDLLLSHVNDVLDLSRLDSSAVAPERGVFQLGDLVQSMLKGQSAAARTRGNRLELRALTPDLDYVLGDAAALNRCLVNLVGNAQKFTAGGEISVEMERIGGGDEVQIRVADTGAGIPEDKLASIFDEFVTVDPTYGRSSSGTGLGLAITRRLIAQMGGTITAESIEGEGSLFQISLPLPPAAAPENSKEPAPDLAPQALRPLRILLVDDNDINREIITDMLEELGQGVTTAADGPQAIALAAAATFDLILMDISMPGMDGLEALRRIRTAEDIGQNCPAIAVTAHAATQDHERIFDEDFSGILTKPVSIAQLRRALALITRSDPERGWVLDIVADQLGATTRADFVSRMGESRFDKLMGDFIGDAGRLLQHVTQQPDASQPALQQKAHNLAGMAGLLGLEQLQRPLKRIEDMLGAGDEVAAQAAAAEARRRLDSLRAEQPLGSP